jgi:hypothetical protein
LRFQEVAAMKTSSLSWLFLGSMAVFSSGCYTVLVAPFSSSGLKEESRSDTVAGTREAARLGRFEDGDDRSGRGYGSGYGYGYGYPVFGAGYDSRYGAYGPGLYGYGPYYGYGYNPYYYGGYGPYGYGYDPYYRSSTGVYVPPGYELVTTRELDELKALNRGLATTPSPSEAEKEALKRAQAKKQQEVWQRRVDPQERPAPVVTPRPAEAPSGGGKEGGNAPKPSSSAPAESAAPKKTRR